MPGSSLPLGADFLALFTVLFSALFTYSAYRAIVVRRALFVRLYRNQALWVGSYGVYWALIFLGLGSLEVLYDENPSFVTGTNLPAYLLFAGLYIGLVLGFLWIDATMMVARRSDPLLRDTLRWTRMRLVLWGVIAVGIFVGLGYIGPQAVTAAGGNPLLELVEFYQGNSVVFAIIGVTSFIALIMAGSRTKDIIFRKQVIALGVYVAVLLAQGLTSFVYTYFSSGALNETFGLLVSAPVTLINTLSLIRTSRVLAPTARLTLDS